MIKKIRNTTYSKNTATGNIINNDVSGYNARLRVIKKNKIQDNRMKSLESKVDDLVNKLEQLLKVNEQ